MKLLTSLLRLLFMAVAAIAAQPVMAQVVFAEDFGTGSGLGSPLPAGTTTYTYNNSMSGVFPDYLLDGQYTIGTNAQQAFTNWASITDHTTGTGRMMIVNATAGVTDEFYRRRITLTPNTTFELAAHLIPLNSQADKTYCDTNEGGLILPNVRMRVETVSGIVLASVDTGPIPFNAIPRWEQYLLRFTTPTQGGEVVLILSNNAPGGCGNDIALDDIIVRVPVTYVAADDNGLVDDATAGVANVLNVTTNDRNSGAPLSNFVLSAANVPPQLTFNTATGVVGVVVGAAPGVYRFTYEVCENTLRNNCDTATVTITVMNPAPPGSGICPVGMAAFMDPGFGASAIWYYNANAPRAAGPLAPAGTLDTGSFSEVTYFSYIQIDLTGDPDILVPGNTPLTLSLTDAWNSGARAQITVSSDGVTFVSLGTIGQGGTLAGAWTSNRLRRNDVTVPGTGIRYVRIVQQNGGVRVDGAAYAQKCLPAPMPQPSLLVRKTSRAFDSPGFLTPGSDVIYEIEVTNTGTGSPDESSVVLIDSLPAEIVFYNADMDDGGTGTTAPVQWISNGSGLAFDFVQDVRFAAGSSMPTDFSQCNYSAASGYDPDIRYICVRPRGTMGSGNAAWIVRFRARIE